jgi:hypothetical protein
MKYVGLNRIRLTWFKAQHWTVVGTVSIFSIDALTLDTHECLGSVESQTPEGGKVGLTECGTEDSTAYCITNRHSYIYIFGLFHALNFNIINFVPVMLR